ncbi:MAG: hypothetical protein ACI4V5_04865, partial [Prevotella sp.]
AAYDFMMATYTTGDNTADIQLRHLGCIMRIEWCLDKGETFKSLTLEADENIFVTQALMNLPECLVTPQTIQPAFTLDLEGVSTEDGMSLVTYIMLYPTDLTGKKIKASLLSVEGTLYEATLEGGQLLAGMSYPVMFGMSDSSRGEAPATYTVASSGQPASTLSSPSVTATDFLYDSEHPLNGSLSTGIQVIEQPVADNRHEGKTYTLSGMRVASPSQNGIYINNGKKFVHHTIK